MLNKIAVVVISLMATVATADVAPDKRHEINYLLNYIKQSDCTLERNGSQHKGIEAVRHIQNKYEYFRNDIETTEDFIKYSATKSTMSGKYYMVYCPGKAPQKTSKWLLKTLELYRFQRRF